LLSLERARAGSAGATKSQVALWLPYTFFTYLFGFSLGPSVRDLHGHLSLGTIKPYLWCLVPTALAALWVGVVVLKRGLKPDVRPAATLCLTLVVVPIALALLTAQVTRISYNVRYTLVAFPPFLLLLGLAAREAGRSLATRAAIAVIIAYMLISLDNHYRDPRYFKEEVRPAVAVLSERLGPSDVLVVSGDTAVPVLGHYGFAVPSGALIVGAPGRGSAETLDRAMNSLERLKPSRGRRVWLLEFRSWESDPGGALRRWLDGNGEALFAGDWPGVALREHAIRGGEDAGTAHRGDGPR